MTRPTANPRRAVPAVDKVLAALVPVALPRPMVVAIVREVLATLRRAQSVPGFEEVVQQVQRSLQDAGRARLCSVINGTGIIIHTNLGRAPLSPAALRGINEAAGYCNLEMDLTDGKRGGRAAHVERCLALLCGAEAAAVVNNCAAALVLALRHYTAAKPEVIISRGELVQIGGGFRIPEILAASGAVLREVGTTNRTTLEDYSRALGPKTGLLLQVHRSNFFMEGFVASPGTAELAALAKKKRVPFVVDLGSGAPCDTDGWAGEHEPTPAEVIKQGATLVCFSGDKLLGGPQAGVIVGSARHVAALKREPFFRALRCDKLVLAAMQGTVEEHLSGNHAANPVQAMLSADVISLRRRARRIVKSLAGLSLKVSVGEGRAQAGGGTLPRVQIPSVTVSCESAGVAGLLRAARTPVIGYVAGNRFHIDLRTVFPSQDRALIAAFREVLNRETIQKPITHEE